jgi:hypothetical protein
LSSQLCEIDQLLKGEGQRRHFQISPDGASTPRVLAVKAKDFVASAFCSENVEVAQHVSELGLGRLVVLRPNVGMRRVAERQLLGRTGLTKLVGDAGVSIWRLPEALPYVLPSALAPGQLPGGSDLAVDSGVKAVVSLALLNESRPLHIIKSRAVASGIVEPPKKASDGIGIDQVVEEVCVEYLLRQSVDTLVQETIEREEQRGTRVDIVGNVQAETAIRMRQQSAHRPITVVRVGKPLTAVLEFGDRCKRSRARVDGSESRATDAG